MTRTVTMIGRLKFLFLCLAISLLGSAFASETITVAKKVEVNANAEEVWAFAGKWAEIDVLLKVIANIEADGDEVGSMRIITLPDGGKVHEKMMTKDALSYSYIFTESPLPVSDFTSKMGVKDLGNGKSEFSWVATMKAKGASDEEVETLFSDLYDSGIAELNAKFP